MEAIRGLDAGQGLAYVIQVFSCFAVAMLQTLATSIRVLDSVLKIGDQTIARVLSCISLASQRPVK